MDRGPAGRVPRRLQGAPEEAPRREQQQDESERLFNMLLSVNYMCVYIYIYIYIYVYVYIDRERERERERDTYYNDNNDCHYYCRYYYMYV